MNPETNKIYVGDCLQLMQAWPDSFVQTVVTSPPYWGLRDYKTKGQIGLEKTPEEYVAKMMAVFREVRRVLREDGTLWLNMGDSYAGSGKGRDAEGRHATNPKWKQSTNKGTTEGTIVTGKRISGFKPKDLIGIPWRLAFALQADGWYLRSDIIWAKPNPMPESVTDRPTRSHEYLFLLAKSERYYYDADAIKERAIYFDVDRQDKPQDRRPIYKDARSYAGKHSDKQRGHGRRHAGFNDRWDLMERAEQCRALRNKRDVWTVATSPFPGAHFATFPSDLINACILAGSRPQDIVLDPFMGAGTTGLVALQYNRQFVGIELNPDYVAMAEKRLMAEKSQLKFA